MVAPNPLHVIPIGSVGGNAGPCTSVQMAFTNLFVISYLNFSCSIFASFYQLHWLCTEYSNTFKEAWLPAEYITTLTKATSCIKNNGIFKRNPWGTPASGYICSVALIWWVILRPLLSADVILARRARARGPFACKRTGHPLACRCVIRQKIRPNSWVLGILRPPYHWCTLMHTHAQAHTEISLKVLL